MQVSMWLISISESMAKLAVLSYSVLLTYIISPHGELYLLEKCATCLTQYDALQCLASVAAEREAEMSIEATEKKCEYIVIICDVFWTVLRARSSDVMSVYIHFDGDALWRLFVLVYKQVSIGCTP